MICSKYPVWLGSGKYAFRGKYEILRKVHAKYTFFINCIYFFITMFEYIKHVICLNFVYIGKHLEKLYEIYIFGNSGKYEILRKVPTACLFILKSFLFFTKYITIHQTRYVYMFCAIWIEFVKVIWNLLFWELAESTKSYGKYHLYAHFEISTHPFPYVVIHKAIFNEWAFSYKWIFCMYFP